MFVIILGLLNCYYIAFRNKMVDFLVFFTKLKAFTMFNYKNSKFHDRHSLS